MSKQWTNQQNVAVPPPEKFHTVEGYKWSRMAIYLDMGRNAPEFLPDEYLDDVINQTWEHRHWLCDR
jgi:hypothetical protein